MEGLFGYTRHLRKLVVKNASFSACIGRWESAPPRRPSFPAPSVSASCQIARLISMNLTEPHSIHSMLREFEQGKMGRLLCRLASFEFLNLGQRSSPLFQHIFTCLLICSIFFTPVVRDSHQFPRRNYFLCGGRCAVALTVPFEYPFLETSTFKFDTISCVEFLQLTKLLVYSFEFWNLRK